MEEKYYVLTEDRLMSFIKDSLELECLESNDNNNNWLQKSYLADSPLVISKRLGIRIEDAYKYDFKDAAQEMINNLKKYYPDIKNKEKDEKTSTEEKRLKGYIYDSLVYRYQLARYKASLKEIEPLMELNNWSYKKAEAFVEKLYERDVMRFCKILDEVIGEKF